MMQVPARIAMLLDMLSEEPSDIFLNYALGMEYVAAGKHSDAETQFKKVLSFDENYVTAYYQLGKLYETMSQNSTALEQYRIGLEKAKTKGDNKAINEFGEAIFMLED